MPGSSVTSRDGDSVPTDEVIETPPLPSRSRLYWAIYTLAWTVFSGVFLLTRCVIQGEGVAEAAPAVLQITAPAAILGVGAVFLTRRWDWPPRSVPGFVLLHVAAASCYSALWISCVSFIVGSRRYAAGEPFEMVGLDSPTLRLLLLFGVLIYGTITAVTYLARIVRRLHVEQQRVVRADALRSRARLEALRARIRPHFLFNALHSVLSLIRRSPARAERALEQLAALLRYATGRGDGEAADEVTLDRELTMVRQYLGLEKLRLGDRLTVKQSVPDDVLDARVPPLAVQPLVENAVQHGISVRGEGGTLEIEAQLRDDGERPAVLVIVRDDGPGRSEEAMETSDGSGLRLVRDRLDLLYGDDADLEIETRPGEGFEARVRIPVEMRRRREPRGRSPDVA